MAQQSIAELATGAKEQVASLAADTIALAKAELGASGKHAGIGAGLVAGALAFVSLATVAITVAFGMGLMAAGLPGWAAFLIVFGAYLLIAAGMVWIAVRHFKKIKGPEKTVASIKGSISALTGVDPDDVLAEAAARKVDIDLDAPATPTPATPKPPAPSGPAPTDGSDAAPAR